MDMQNIEVMDIFEDGTLLLKTNYEGSPNAKYAWYIKHNKEVIFKSSYQSKPFFVHKVETPGVYCIKGFVKDGEQKETFEAKYSVDNINSPKLINQFFVNNGMNNLIPQIEQISKGFWKMYVETNQQKDLLTAWYIYKKDDNQPIHKEMYSNRKEFFYKFNVSGTYFVKCFFMLNGAKCVKDSEYFEVQV